MKRRLRPKIALLEPRAHLKGNTEELASIVERRVPKVREASKNGKREIHFRKKLMTKEVDFLDEDGFSEVEPFREVSKVEAKARETETSEIVFM